MVYYGIFWSGQFIYGHANKAFVVVVALADSRVGTL